jgi:hypothetical protein
VGFGDGCVLVGAVSACAFGFVERRVGVFDGEFCRIVLGVDGVADAEGDEWASCSPAVEETVRDVVGGFVGYSAADEKEFFAAIAGDGVGGAGEGAQVVTHLGEDLVARLMAERVVDGLEVVEVEDEDGVAGLEGLDAGMRGSAVPDAGEGVVGCRVGEGVNRAVAAIRSANRSGRPIPVGAKRLFRIAAQTGKRHADSIELSRNSGRCVVRRVV